MTPFSWFMVGVGLTALVMLLIVLWYALGDDW